MAEQAEVKRLYRSKDNRIIAGVLGGIGEYLNVDPVVVRVIYIIFMAMSGFFPLILAYILLLLVIPEKPETQKHN